jgi:hypothetical protein
MLTFIHGVKGSHPNLGLSWLVLCLHVAIVASSGCPVEGLDWKWIWR